MTAYQTKLLMYYEIQRMNREGFSIARISRTLQVNWRTIRHYLAMSETDYDRFLEKNSERAKALQPYEVFVQSRLQKYPDTSAAQMHDWLKEKYADIDEVSTRTVFNFVAWIRQKYNLPKISEPRVYEIVDELPYGQQAQVDFGFYNMPGKDGKRVKVSFFIMVLSRSRYKYVWFSDTHFTAALAVIAHELAFTFFGGIPAEIVYDQDRVFITDENMGDIILTDDFKAYTRERSFSLRFCRKADPESKGKVENVVKYVKRNFLYNRPYEDLETLNIEAHGWLARTANALPHGFTQKAPAAEWEIEKAFLTPCLAYTPKPHQQAYTLRKDNTLSWKSNFYTVPSGTYKGRESRVLVAQDNGQIIVSDLSGKEICRHYIAAGKGQKVKNTDHTRDKASAITELIDQVCILLDDPIKGQLLFSVMRTDRPRYIRDQVLIMRDCIEQYPKQLINLGLDYCCKNGVKSASDFKAVVQEYSRQQKPLQKQQPTLVINPLSGAMNAAKLSEPAKSNIQDYEIALQNKPTCR
jgi:transposase